MDVLDFLGLQVQLAQNWKWLWWTGWGKCWICRKSFFFRVLVEVVVSFRFVLIKFFFDFKLSIVWVPRIWNSPVNKKLFTDYNQKKQKSKHLLFNNSIFTGPCCNHDSFPSPHLKLTMTQNVQHNKKFWTCSTWLVEESGYLFWMCIFCLHFADYTAYLMLIYFENTSILGRLLSGKLFKNLNLNFFYRVLQVKLH